MIMIVMMLRWLRIPIDYPRQSTISAASPAIMRLSCTLPTCLGP